MPARFGGDHTALFEGVLFRADNLQIDGAGVAVVVQHPDVAKQVNIPTSVGLIFGFAGVLLAALTIADVDVLDARDHRFQGVYGVFTRAVNVRRIHVDAERRAVDSRHDLERRRRVVDASADVRLDT